MHNMGYAHRDLKPDNILLQGNKFLLADFGESTQVDKIIKIDGHSLISEGDLKGTPRYMSPILKNANKLKKYFDIEHD